MRCSRRLWLQGYAFAHPAHDDEVYCATAIGKTVVWLWCAMCGGKKPHAKEDGRLVYRIPEDEPILEAAAEAYKLRLRRRAVNVVQLRARLAAARWSPC